MSIQRQDILTDDAVIAPLQLAENLLKAKEAAFEMVTTLRKYDGALQTDSPSKLKKKTDELTASQKELEKIQKQIAIAQAKQNEQVIEATKRLQAEKEALKQKIALGNQDAKSINAQTASIEKLKAALDANRRAYDRLTNEQQRNTKEGKELLEVIELQAKEYDELKMKMGQAQQRVGNYEGAIKELKLELRAARDEMAGVAKQFGTDSPQFIAAAQRAGQVKDQINDLNDAMKNTSASNIENLSNSFGMMAGQLKAGDFGGAAQSARQFADTLKATSSKEIIDGLKGIGGAFATIGKALLANPIFIVAGVFAGVVAAYHYFSGEADKLSEKMIKNYKAERDALTERYDHEIKLKQIAGKQTFADERAKENAIIANLDNELKAGRIKAEVDYVKSMLTRQTMMKFKRVELTKEEQKEIEAEREAARKRIEIINAQEAKFTQDKYKETTEKLKAELEKRIQAEIEAGIKLAEQQLKIDEELRAAAKRIAEQDAIEAAKLEEEKEEGTSQEMIDSLKLRAAHREKDRQNELAQQTIFKNNAIAITNEMASVIEGTIMSNQNMVKNLSKLGLRILLDTIERQLLMTYAGALFQATSGSMVTGQSLATGGTAGLIQAAAIAAVIKGAFAVARAQLTKAIEGFEKGTSFAPGGPAIVGEAGPELIQSPSGKFTLSPGQPTLTYLERGSKVFTADETLSMLAAKGLPTSTISNNSDFIALGRAFQYATEKSAEKIIKGYMKARPGDLVRNGSILYEYRQDDQRNRQRIRKSVMSK